MSRFVRPGRAALTVAIAASLLLIDINPSSMLAQGRQERSSQPQITSVSPAAKASDKAQVLTINGRNFVEGLALEVTSPEGQAQVLSGQDVRDLRDSSFQVAIVLAHSGNYSFVVRNKDGGASNAFPLKVPPSASAPSIERIEPTSVPRGTNPQRVTVVGRNFMAGLSVTLTDPTGEVAVIRDGIGTVSATSFAIDLTLTVAGEYSLLVTNPSTENSNSVTLTVTNGGARPR